MEGLHLLHLKGISHRDIKPENIFKKQGLYKLGDFGFATKNNVLNSYVGTPLYMAPELNQVNLKYDAKVDIWAMGIILYQMIFGALPFKKQVDFSLKLEIPQDGISKDCKDLIEKMLDANPKTRLSSIDCLKHPFLLDISLEWSFNNLDSENKKNSFINIEDKKKITDENAHFKYLANRLENYDKAAKSITKIVLSNLRSIIKNNNLVTQFILVRRVYYYIKYMDSFLSNDLFPRDLIYSGYIDLWPQFTKSADYIQMKTKVTTSLCEFGKLLKLTHDKIMSSSIDMSDSLVYRAITQDTVQNFTATYFAILNKQINELKQNIKTIETQGNRDLVWRVIFDLKYAIFVDGYLKNHKYLILCEDIQEDRKLLPIYAIQKAIEDEMFFRKYLKINAFKV